MRFATGIYQHSYVIREIVFEDKRSRESFVLYASETADSYN